MQTPDDLNNLADVQAALYDGVSWHTADPGLTGGDVASGGAKVAVTFTAGGVEGPTSDHAAVDGIAWSVSLTVNLSEPATHIGLWDGSTFRRGVALPSPLPTGARPFVFGIGPAA